MLGFRNRGSRANVINRYRVRAALRSIDPRASTSVLVLCGGSVGSEVPEAELMANYVRDELGFRGPVRLDPISRSTWENVENAIPLVEEFETIKMVSNSMHAEKARAYLWMLRPDLARRLVQAEEHRFGELLFAKPFAAALGIRNLSRLRS